MVLYIATVCLAVVVAMYMYSWKVQAFANMGLDYLHSLENNIDKLNNDAPTIMMLQVRDIPNFTTFVGTFPRIRSAIIAAVIVNIAVIILYPYDVLLYTWMAWVVNLAAIIANIDATIMFLILRRNKNTISRICNAYYDIVIRNEEQAKVEQVVKEIDNAFDEMVKDIDTIRKAEENKDANDE